MNNEIFSVQVLIVKDGKKENGTLLLGDDYYEYNGNRQDIDWEKTDYTVGTEQVPSLFRAKERPCISFCCNELTSPKYVMDEAFINEAKNHLAKLKQSATDRRILEEKYQKALAVMREAKTVRDFQDAAVKFNALENYKDSQKCHQQCSDEIKRLKEEAELKRKDGIYQKAIADKKVAKTAEDFTRVAKDFSSISDYKDSEKLSKECWVKVEDIHKEEELKRKEAEYQKALELMKTAKTIKEYSAVQVSFESISDYKDCKEKAEYCKEVVAKLKKEEAERKAKEERERKEKERSERIAKEVEEAKKDNTVDSFDDIKDPAVRKAFWYVLSNPYRIIGVACSSPYDEQNEAVEKLKKLERLKAMDSYKALYALRGIAKPDRDIASVQNAFAYSSKEITDNWFWVADKTMCEAWKNPEYQKELVRDGNEYGTYDLFLANYFYGILYDFNFTNAELWNRVFNFYSYICTQKDCKLLRSRFNSKDLEPLTNSQLLNSFRSEILKPIEELVKSEDINIAVNVYNILKNNKDKKLDALRRIVTGGISTWFKKYESEVMNELKAYNDVEEISESQRKEIKKIGDDYISAVEKDFERIVDVVKKETVCCEMIKESYRFTTWQLMFHLNKAEAKGDAIYFANKTYPHCKEEDKRLIRNTFGFNNLKGCDKDVTNSELDIMGDNYMNGANGYPVDYKKAVEYYTKAANQGNKYSQNSLGICYSEGKGVVKNQSTAASWFEKAYRNGNPDGAYNLAQCYATGEGRVMNLEKAIEYWGEAAKLGHPDAAKRALATLALIELAKKQHRLEQHHDYDLGYQSGYPTVIVEVELNYSANVYLMDNSNYQKYRQCDNFSYYGGRALQSPYRVKIPHSGWWHLVIDNGDDDMTGIYPTVHTRTLNF